MARATKGDGEAKLDIRAVAKRARVSIATVSRTINRLASVDPALAARVWKAVEELNYVPNTQARALVSGRSKLIGLIVSEITNPFFPELVQEFERIAVQSGYEILIASTSYDLKKMESCVRRMLERKVDGVAVMTFGIEKLVLDRFAAGDMPTVFIDSAPQHPLSSVIMVDYKQGIFQGVQHLAVLGHRKICFMTGPLNLRSAELRKEAFLQSMRATGLPVHAKWILEGDHTLDGGRDAMSRILAMKQWPTAILCSNDMMAIGVQHALFEAELSVPKDFSLIGFDDIHLAEYTIPPLTTVRMSCRDLAQAAFKSLTSRLAGREVEPGAFQVQTGLVVRQTTGLPRGAMSDLQPEAGLTSN